ncbi:hypothetical protein IV203_022072 [Nitzschia inconspicua]|uniref:CRAL-TRIO domain-containing protein n=1 Tax=Nitzschia inconspicua TaxID=303405 RepID=A0A9K3KJD5_9STRA|nr:hypothetical protein IV203_022072 [Nitzschia inconspicua]
MMKRKASATELEYQSPPQCGFNESGSVRRGSAFNNFEMHPSQTPAAHSNLYGDELEDVEETPMLVKELLENLHFELGSCLEKTNILSILKGCSPCPLENDDLMLRFLRVERYNLQSALKRIVKHYEMKLELFGHEKLGTRITLDDLDHEDLKTLRSGGFQSLPSRDRDGRVVVYERFQTLTYKSPRNLFRIVWFVSMSVVEDAGHKGHIVLISFQTGPFSPDLFDRVVYKKTIHILSKLLPLKLAGFHFCFDDVRFRMVWGLATIYLGKEAKQRAVNHEGTALECRYGLMSYGINVDDLPVTVDGADDHTKLRRWVEQTHAEGQEFVPLCLNRRKDTSLCTLSAGLMR